MEDIKGKAVIVTGAGVGGIGYGVAKAFLKRGAKVAVTGKALDHAREAELELKKECGGEILAVGADGGDEEQVKRAVEAVYNAFGRIDVLINNAQASTPGLQLEQHEKKDIDLAIDSGLYAVFYYMKHCLPYLKETKGSVINFASGAGLFGKPGQSAYAAAKEGIRGLSRAAATEWGPYGVRVNVICPLVMTRALEKWKNDNPQLYEQAVRNVPLGRFGDAEKDIGGVCLFLASEMSSYLTGETLTVQGGSGLRP